MYISVCGSDGKDPAGGRGGVPAGACRRSPAQSGLPEAEAAHKDNKMNRGLSEWEMYLEHGRAFYKCAAGGLGKPEKFNEDALFNLAAMAIEKMSMGFLMKRSVMPQGHSFLNLVESMDELAPLPLLLKEQIVRLDIYQETYCSLAVFRPNPVTREDIPPMLEICGRLQVYVQENLSA